MRRSYSIDTITKGGKWGAPKNTARMAPSSIVRSGAMRTKSRPGMTFKGVVLSASFAHHKETTLAGTSYNVPQYNQAPLPTSPVPITYTILVGELNESTTKISPEIVENVSFVNGAAIWASTPIFELDVAATELSKKNDQKPKKIYHDNPVRGTFELRSGQVIKLTTMNKTIDMHVGYTVSVVGFSPRLQYLPVTATTATIPPSAGETQLTIERSSDGAVEAGASVAVTTIETTAPVTITRAPMKYLNFDRILAVDNDDYHCKHATRYEAIRLLATHDCVAQRIKYYDGVTSVADYGDAFIVVMGNVTEDDGAAMQARKEGTYCMAVKFSDDCSKVVRSKTTTVTTANGGTEEATIYDPILGMDADVWQIQNTNDPDADVRATQTLECSTAMTIEAFGITDIQAWKSFAVYHVPSMNLMAMAYPEPKAAHAMDGVSNQYDVKQNMRAVVLVAEWREWLPVSGLEVTKEVVRRLIRAAVKTNDLVKPRPLVTDYIEDLGELHKQIVLKNKKPKHEQAIRIDGSWYLKNTFNHSSGFVKYIPELHPAEFTEMSDDEWKFYVLFSAEADIALKSALDVTDYQSTNASGAADYDACQSKFFHTDIFPEDDAPFDVYLYAIRRNKPQYVQMNVPTVDEVSTTAITKAGDCEWPSSASSSTPVPTPAPTPAPTEVPVPIEASPTVPMTTETIAYGNPYADDDDEEAPIKPEAKDRKRRAEPSSSTHRATKSRKEH